MTKNDSAQMGQGYLIFLIRPYFNGTLMSFHEKNSIYREQVSYFVLGSYG